VFTAADCRLLTELLGTRVLDPQSAHLSVMSRSDLVNWKGGASELAEHIDTIDQRLQLYVEPDVAYENLASSAFMITATSVDQYERFFHYDDQNMSNKSS